MDLTRWLQIALIAVASCGTAPAVFDSGSRSSDGLGDATDLAPWPVPPQWTHEVLTFPLSFASSIAQNGVEELRFPPAVFDPTSTNYWSYAFAWRLLDTAELDADELGTDLTAYYRGLLVAADTTHEITMPAEIVAHALVAPSGFTFTAHLVDSFNQAQVVDVAGAARRVTCGEGAVWVFDLSPTTSSAQLVRTELDQLAGEAECGQPPQ